MFFHLLPDFLISTTLILLLALLPLPATWAQSSDTMTSASQAAAEGDAYYEGEYLDEQAGPTIADPLAPLNQVIFKFNDKFYLWILEPVATGYKKIAPAPLRRGIRNFFKNLLMPPRLVNSLLQAKWDGAGREGARFGINTTIGVLGFMDPAKHRFQIEAQVEDLGQTLGHYGIGHGCYLVLPFLGPNSLRDTLGIIGDGFLEPWNYLSDEVIVIAHPVRIINDASFRLGEYEDIKQSALYPYDSFRDIYAQYRANKIRE